MNKRWLFLLLIWTPLAVFADSTISFAPPTTDYSVTWLANIFGIVDGVLHGSGSQIIGQMFSIFNAAVMALGGIIITYTMLVSTMNTAHEGEMLGKKWSSIWVPVRATAGFALLVPKASGYCLLQIFVMWVVVQGVGAADKLWNAALSYLNRGGVIIETQADPTTMLTGSTPNQQVTEGAAAILSGQVCMLALERILKHRLAEVKPTQGPTLGSSFCKSEVVHINTVQAFCNEGTVPSFIDSVDITGAANNPSNKGQAQIKVFMPDFSGSTNAFYRQLTGICGSIAWNSMDTQIDALTGLAAKQASNSSSGISGMLASMIAHPNQGTNTAGIGAAAGAVAGPLGAAFGAIVGAGVASADNNPQNQQQEIDDLQGAAMAQEAGLSSAELDTAKKARTAAVQQMYSDLQAVAEVMVNNDPDPLLSLSTAAPSTSSTGTELPNPIASAASQANTANTSTPDEPWATDSFGVPLDNQGNPCVTNQTINCSGWGPLPSSSSSGGALFNGTELQGAVLDYMGVINPTLTLLNESVLQSRANQNKQFILQAESSGWIMAGTYFFDLVLLNNTNMSSSNLAAGDGSSGLDQSAFSLDELSFDSTCTNASVPSTALCAVLNGNSAGIQAIYALFTGSTGAGSSSTASGASSMPSANPDSFNASIVTSRVINAIPGASTSNQTTGVTSPSTVFGYLQNALVIQMPGQPPTPPLQFANIMHANFQGTSFSLPPANFSCMGVTILFVELCIGRWIGDIIYYGILKPVMTAIGNWLMSLVYGIVMNALMIPLNAMAAIFTEGVKILDVPGINPIVALANMGTYYINFVGKLWFVMLLGQLVSMAVSMVGIFLMPILVMALPITITWSIIMLGVGFICAYYVPLIPYMIFTFGAIAWFMAVIEAMVAAPIVALGVIHPEGHDIFGKGEAAIMILMNVFLRPSMMIIGYIAGISLSYVGIWFLNAGYDHAVSFMQPSQHEGHDGSINKYAGIGAAVGALGGPVGALAGGAIGSSASSISSNIPPSTSVSGGYTQWAGVFAFFFSILIYTTIYMTIVEKAFSLISALPDKILRWIGGQPEGYGSDSAQWAGEGKKAVESSSKEAGNAMVQAGKGAQGALTSGDSGQGNVQAEQGPSPGPQPSPNAQPSPPTGGGGGGPDQSSTVQGGAAKSTGEDAAAATGGLPPV